MKHNDMKQWLMPTSCLGCAISITAFKRNTEDDFGDSIYMMMLSEHAHLYLNTWRVRLREAWNALRGNYLEDISLELPEDIETFKKTMDEVYAWMKEGR